MALKLLAAHHTVRVYNRTREKAEPVLAKGALWADTPADVAKESDVIISMVTDPAAVRDIALGNIGVLEAMGSGSVHCDMSTVSPASASEISAIYRQREKRFVQAPVSGSIRQIEDGTLLVFAGGREEDVQRGEEAWRSFASRTWHLDRPDKASAAKLAVNMLIGHMILGLGQSMLFAQKHEVAPATFLEMLGASAMGCPMYNSKGQSLLTRNFAPNFVVANLLKDLTLAADSARAVALPQPFNSLTREIFVAATNKGWTDEDYSAAVKVLEDLAGSEVSSAD
jgi:3-hydroxyisobutyrate dehydrogenase-like beta-hydroxyacid dehydrogenase